MLNSLGKFITRNRWWVIGFWIVLVVAITAFSPKLSSVTTSSQTSFLSSKYESVRAGNVGAKSFPQSKDDTEVLLVTRKDGGKLTTDDHTAIQQLASKLQATHIKKVVAVMTGPMFISKDGTAQMVQIIVNAQASGGTSDNSFTTDVRSKVKQLVAGTNLQTGLTGAIAESADSNGSFNTATKIVTMATFALVIILPGLIFRSPVAAFAPVIAVTLVYLLSQSLIALAAKTFNFQISNQLSILYTVVLFGIGTDYILFLLFRYRERLRSGERGRDAVAYALSHAGEAILSAALVVAAAFAALGLSDFGLFKNLAPGLVICVLVMLLAVLTLIPAVVAVIGPRIFWPSKAWQQHPQYKIPKRIGRIVGTHPGAVALCALIVLVGLASGYPKLHMSYDFSNQQPQNTESAKAYSQVSKLFSAGAITPTEVFVTSDSRITPNQLDLITTKIDAIPNVKSGGISRLSADGKTALITVLLPGSPESDATLNLMQNTVRPQVHAAVPSGDNVYVGGETAAFVDVRSAVNRDLAVILPSAAVIIFVILALLLRSALAPLYLLIATALGFTATLGGTVYLFQTLQHNSGLIFFIPIMVYIFVVAIGTDYNILTMTRLREEVRHGMKPRQASYMTVVHSSSTVASAGLILAGTFGSLALAGISLLSQLGFAVAFGIVLAAFCIAPLLVPSVAALLGYKVWWPGHRPANDKNRP
jgi:RND superfamily putative drug exporter